MVLLRRCRNLCSPSSSLLLLISLLACIQPVPSITAAVVGKGIRDRVAATTKVGLPWTPWWTNNEEGSIQRPVAENKVTDFGTARYPSSRATLQWDDLEARGKLGSTCDPGRSVQAQCGKNLVCRNGLCRHCVKDSECPSLHKCHKMNFETANSCVRVEKKAWELAFSEPLEFMCSITIFFASALAAAAGTGGGGMFVPLLVSMSSLTADKAVPTSQCMILLGSIVNLGVFLAQRHPVVKAEPVIDYDCVVLLEPMLCLGVMLGVMVNQITPNWMVLVMLCITLGVALQRTGSKGISQLKAEIANPPVITEETILELKGAPAGGLCGMIGVGVSDDFLELTNAKSWQVILTVLIWMVMLASSFHGIPVCTQSFLIFLLQLAAFLLVATFVAARKIHNDAEAAGLQSPRRTQLKNGPVDWTQGMLKYPFYAWLAGFLGGLLGLGGGIIMSPVLVEVGMHSEAVQATTALFVFLSSSLATIQFARLHQHVWHYALWYGFICVTATMLGQHLCETYVRKRKRYSFITLAIAGVLLCSLLALSVIGSLQVAEDIYLGRQMGFSTSSLCNRAGTGIVAVDIVPASPWPEDLA